jgi:hypothetical protein
VDDLGFPPLKDQAAGLILFEGHAHQAGSSDGYDTWIDYRGAYRRPAAGELPGLLAMEPVRLCAACKAAATTRYPDDDGEWSCGSPACELRMQAAIDYHDEAGDR